MSFRSNPFFKLSSPLAPPAQTAPSASAPLLKVIQNPDISICPERAPEAQASLSYAYVYTDEQLSAALDDLGAPEVLYIDTEFQGFKRNSPVVLSLIQVSGGGTTYVIDAMEIELKAHRRLVSLFGRPEVEWVLHDANQDVELICNALGVDPPRRLFDTQVAWGIFNFEKSISLLNLTFQLCGARLNKLHKAAAFARRPLTEQMISYAASDVPPLIVARAQLGEQLERRNLTDRLYALSHARLPAHLSKLSPSEAEALTPTLSPALSAPQCLSGEGVSESGAPTWSYTPRQLIALYCLCAWRASLPEAERAELARLLHPRLFKSVVQRAPVNISELNEVQGVADMRRLYGGRVTSVIQDGVAGAPEAWITDPAHPLYERWGVHLRPAPPASIPLEGHLRRAWLKYILNVCSARFGVSHETFLSPHMFRSLELFTLEGPDGDPLAELRPLLTGEEGALFLRALEEVARETPLPSTRPLTPTPLTSPLIAQPQRGESPA